MCKQVAESAPAQTEFDHAVVVHATLQRLLGGTCSVRSAGDLEPHWWSSPWWIPEPQEQCKTTFCVPCNSHTHTSKHNELRGSLQCWCVCLRSLVVLLTQASRMKLILFQSESSSAAFITVCKSPSSDLAVVSKYSEKNHISSNYGSLSSKSVFFLSDSKNQQNQSNSGHGFHASRSDRVSGKPITILY